MGMQVSVQNGTVLYKKPGPVLVPEGVYDAELIDVRKFAGSFGDRVGLVYRITTGSHAGVELMESAAPKNPTRGKLADMLRGMGGEDGSLLTAHRMVGHSCRILIRHEATKTGKPYAAIVQTFQR